MNELAPSTVRPALPTFAEAARVWARIALLSFGGPAGQIALMHRIVVEERRWIGDDRFLHALNFCMLLPGPEAQQLATYIGWLMHRTPGAILAGVLFVLPGAVAILALSMIYAVMGGIGPVAALFFGLKAAVLAIVLQAVVRIGRRALRTGAMKAIAAASFVAIFAFDVPFPAIIVTAGLIGFVGGRAHHPAFRSGGHSVASSTHVPDEASLLGTREPAHPRTAALIATAAACLVLWLAPTVAFVAAGTVPYADIASFFSTMAVVTFGGAYAVLAYVAQEAVGTYGWLAPGEMLDGLGLAETTPGPLIMVTQFVGFLAAYRDPGTLAPLLAGTLGAALTTWVTFVPCFLFVLVGAPFMERLRANRVLTAALAAITAAVVGVILNLAVWFALHVLFREVMIVGSPVMALDVPVLSTLDPAAAVLSAAAVVAVFMLRLGVVSVLGLAAGAGLGLHVGGFV